MDKIFWILYCDCQISERVHFFSSNLDPTKATLGNYRISLFLPCLYFVHTLEFGVIDICSTQVWFAYLNKTVHCTKLRQRPYQSSGIDRCLCITILQFRQAVSSLHCSLYSKKYILLSLLFSVLQNLELLGSDVNISLIVGSILVFWNKVHQRLH